jgi:hypothetical protein
MENQTERERKEVNLRVWWIPQVPMKPFHIDVKNIEQAVLILRTLADYDAFQFKNNVKPDYCNAGGLEIFNVSEQEWEEWADEDGDEIDEYCYKRKKL